MNSRIGDHPEELLPWYVNGTLEGEERRRVEEHLGSCLVCRRDVEELREMRRAVKEASATSSPGEAGLARLQRHLATERETRHGRRPRRASLRRRWRHGLSAVAALLLAALGIGWWTMRETPAPARYRAEEEPLVRALVGPAEALPRDRFLLRWEPSAATRDARFDVRVRTRDLEPVAEARGLEEPEYLIPASSLADLAPGTRLFWQVEVVQPGGVRLRSATFQVAVE